MIPNDVYWEWVDDLPPELKSEQEYREVQAQELCDDMIESGFCKTCKYYSKCEYRSKPVQGDL